MHQSDIHRQSTDHEYLGTRNIATCKCDKVYIYIYLTVENNHLIDLTKQETRIKNKTNLASQKVYKKMNACIHEARVSFSISLFGTLLPVF